MNAPIRLYMSMSLDGFIAGPDDRPGQELGQGGGRLSNWLDGRMAPGVDGQVYGEAMATGAVISGRRTFELAGRAPHRRCWLLTSSTSWRSTSSRSCWAQAGGCSTHQRLAPSSWSSCAGSRAATPPTFATGSAVDHKTTLGQSAVRSPASAGCRNEIGRAHV